MKNLVIGAVLAAAILSLPVMAMDRLDPVFDTKISKTIALDNTTAFTVLMDGEQDKATTDGRKIEIERESILRRANGLGDMVFANPISGMNFFRFSGKLVKNAPYSAEVISESQQKLADGNMISNKSSTLTYRDSQGRTREEIRDAKGELREIIINDPAEGHIILNPKTKVATKLMNKFLMNTKSNGEPLKIVTENITRSKDGKEIVELKLTAGDNKDAERHVIVRRVEKMGTDAKAGDNERTLTVNVLGPENRRQMELVMPGMSGSGALNASLANVFGDAKWANKRQTKALGNKDFDGVKAEGKQSSFEIPAGEIGNANPIVVSDETWFSPDLQITVYSKHSDPRSGDRIYRLNNIKRDDVAASMFAVPSDYKMRDIAKDIKDVKEIKEIRVKREDKKDKE
nr:hypothetical protein [uncultured Undibacterium sp.]